MFCFCFSSRFFLPIFFSFCLFFFLHFSSNSSPCLFSYLLLVHFPSHPLLLYPRLQFFFSITTIISPPTFSIFTSSLFLLSPSLAFLLVVLPDSEGDAEEHGVSFLSFRAHAFNYVKGHHGIFILMIYPALYSSFLPLSLI